ncbi:hypothetical protein LSAT2_022645 [Lamellibrachia satsuma]|nr:hypothetical protein LSAT2_022645 [Lamellibrachia satsuma]
MHRFKRHQWPQNDRGEDTIQREVDHIRVVQEEEERLPAKWESVCGSYPDKKPTAIRTATKDENVCTLDRHESSCSTDPTPVS